MIECKAKIRKPEKVLKIIVKFIETTDAPVKEIKKLTDTPFKSLIMAILSTRTKDKTLIEISKELFSRIKTPFDLDKLTEEEIDKMIYKVGFHRVKARNLKKLAKILIEKYNGEIPLKKEELLKLPGVGIKVANVVLSKFGGDEIAVDVHTFRISKRLGWSKGKNPIEVEKDLKKLFPKNMWNKINYLLVAFGQTICKAKPLCDKCPLNFS